MFDKVHPGKGACNHNKKPRNVLNMICALCDKLHPEESACGLYESNKDKRITQLINEFMIVLINDFII